MNSTLEFQDVIEAPSASNRTVTADGYLIAPATLARVGVQRYRADEIGLKDRKPDDMVGVYRSRETLAQSVDSFESQAITLDHRWTNSSNWRAHAVGDVREVTMQGDTMIGTLIVRDQRAIEKIRDGKATQLSNGYKAEIVPSRGSYQGQSYEYEQTSIMGNHVAIVDKARCGSTCRIMDSAGCACGGGEKCTCKKEADPRREFIKRQERSWLKNYQQPHDAPEDDAGEQDARRRYIERLQNIWQHPLDGERRQPQ